MTLPASRRTLYYDWEGLAYYYRYETLDESALALLLLVSAACLYQVERIARRYVTARWFATKARKPSATKQKPKRPPVPFDPIEQELNQLKGQLGVTKMQSVRRSPPSPPTRSAKKRKPRAKVR
ncbi:MAG: hypothetical protein ACFB9N_10345 [Geitlerinemataceae cyanobacterium]